MLRNGILQDTFGMSSFLRLIGLPIDGSSVKFLRRNRDHKILYVWNRGKDKQDSMA